MSQKSHFDRWALHGKDLQRLIEAAGLDGEEVLNRVAARLSQMREEIKRQANKSLFSSGPRGRLSTDPTYALEAIDKAEAALRQVIRKGGAVLVDRWPVGVWWALSDALALDRVKLRRCRVPARLKASAFWGMLSESWKSPLSKETLSRLATRDSRWRAPLERIERIESLLEHARTDDPKGRGRRIACMRKLLGLTQHELAQLAGVPYWWVAQIEVGGIKGRRESGDSPTYAKRLEEKLKAIESAIEHVARNTFI